MAVRSKNALSFAPTVNGSSSKRTKMTEKERKRLEGLVKKAKTLAEVQKLEKALAEGRLPAGVGEDDESMDET